MNPIGIMFNDCEEKYRLILSECSFCKTSQSIPWSKAGHDLKARAVLAEMGRVG